jgi:hypothetical protein
MLGTSAFSTRMEFSVTTINVDSALEPGSLFFRQHTNNDHHPMVFALEAAILATSFITATSKIA